MKKDITSIGVGYAGRNVPYRRERKPNKRMQANAGCARAADFEPCGVLSGSKTRKRVYLETI